MAREEFVVQECGIGDFIQFLRGQHRAVIDTKDESILFNASVFDPPAGAVGYRRQAYFKASSFMVLDFDDGDLSPEAFEQIFWSEAGRGRKRSFVICNSFSRCAATPNKFRVILFYKRPATTLQQHQAVYDAIVARLKEHDFSAESARLDPACRSGVPIFLSSVHQSRPSRVGFLCRTRNEGKGLGAMRHRPGDVRQDRSTGSSEAGGELDHRR